MIRQFPIISLLLCATGCGPSEVKSCAEIATAQEIERSKGVCEQEGYILSIDGSYFVTNSPDYDAIEYLVGLGGIEEEKLQFMRDNQGKRVYVSGRYVKMAADTVTMEDMQVFNSQE